MERVGAELECGNYEQARDMHKAHVSFVEKTNEATIASGQAAIRNLFLMHGGALVAMLTFISGLLSNNSTHLQVDSLIAPMIRFALGLAFAAAASCSTYLTNYCYAAGASRCVLNWSPPYIQRSRLAKIWMTIGLSFHVAAIILASASLVFFVWVFLT
ncbi:hypothetical protein [Rhodovulum sulfidophilum]|uniref:hypothetical protein n=1 Tax=Rhodovulum sulfidophilum TaxID=35806 RepID=UPI0019127D88|nr:hypothetical protein [Rhodovulum sulfidophilum]